MSNTPKITKAAALALVTAIIAGTEKHFPNGSFTLGNVTYSTASLVQLLQSLADAMTSQDAAQASAKDAVATAKGVKAKVDPVYQLYKRFLLTTFVSATPDARGFRSHASQGASPENRRAEGGYRGEGEGHA